MWGGFFHSSTFPYFPPHKKRDLPNVYSLTPHYSSSTFRPFFILHTVNQSAFGSSSNRRDAILHNNLKKIEEVWYDRLTWTQDKPHPPGINSIPLFRVNKTTYSELSLLLHLLHYLFIYVVVVDNYISCVKKDLLFIFVPLFDWLVLLTPRASLNKNRWRHPPNGCLFEGAKNQWMDGHIFSLLRMPLMFFLSFFLFLSSSHFPPSPPPSRSPSSISSPKQDSVPSARASVLSSHLSDL